MAYIKKSFACMLDMFLSFVCHELSFTVSLRLPDAHGDTK
jgi:hypothetical protein